MTHRKLIAAGLFAALPLALAGCSSSSTPAATGSPAGNGAPAGNGTPAATATPSTPAAAPSASTAQLTGTQLAAALLKASDIGSGYADDSSSATDSGSSLTTDAAKYQPASLSCADLLDDLGQPGFGESAMAYAAPSNQSDGDEVDESVYQFATASAANTFFTSLHGKWGSCSSFSVTESGTSAKVTITPASSPSGLGDMAFENSMKLVVGGHTVSGSMLFVLEGTDVFELSPGNPSGAVPTVSLQTLMTKLIANVAAAH